MIYIRIKYKIKRNYYSFSHRHIQFVSQHVKFLYRYKKSILLGKFEKFYFVIPYSIWLHTTKLTFYMSIPPDSLIVLYFRVCVFLTVLLTGRSIWRLQRSFTNFLFPLGSPTSEGIKGRISIGSKERKLKQLQVTSSIFIVINYLIKSISRTWYVKPELFWRVQRENSLFLTSQRSTVRH